MSFERIFRADVLTKRERVERTLDHLPVDRVALHEQLSYNPGVISLYAGKAIAGYDYTYEDICAVIRKTLDACFPPVAPLGTERFLDKDGFTIQQDNWHSSIVSRPFHDVAGAREFLLRLTDRMDRLGRRGGYGYPPGITPSERALPARQAPCRRLAQSRLESTLSQRWQLEDCHRGSGCLWR